MPNFENVKEVFETIRLFSPDWIEGFVGREGKVLPGSSLSSTPLSSDELRDQKGQEPPLDRSPGKESNLATALKAQPGLKRRRKSLSLKLLGSASALSWRWCLVLVSKLSPTTVPRAGVFIICILQVRRD